MPSKYPAIRRAIMDGEVDEFLDEIAMTVANRRQMAARQMAYTLEPGDMIIISRNCKPKMLAGQLVIFEGQDQSKLKVKLTQSYSAKWVKDAVIRIPPTLVGKVVKGA